MGARSTFRLRRDGVFRILNRPQVRLTELNRVELNQFSSSILATRTTFLKFGGMRQLRLWEGIALCYFLDPGALLLNRVGQFEAIQQVVGHLEDQDAQRRLANFISSLQTAVGDAHAGILKCIKGSGAMMHSFVSVDQLERYASEHLVWGGDESLLDPKPEKRRVPKDSDVIRDIRAGEKLWKKFNPTDSATIPDLEAFFLGKGYSARQSSVMAGLCRPENAPKGRPRKTTVHPWKMAQPGESTRHF
jgi:hypothetical protein